MDKVLSLLGLARRARAVAAGHAACLDALKHNKATLLILARDASENTKKEFLGQAVKRGVPAIELARQEQLGLAIGKMPHAVLAVLDQGLAGKIIETAGVLRDQPMT